MDKRIKQVSVFLENTLGRLDEVLSLLSENEIDLIGLSMAETSSFGLLRLIVSNSGQALEALKKAGYTAQTTNVFALGVPDRPGGLADVLKELKANHVSIEYLYSLVRRADGMAILIVRVDNSVKAAEALNECKTIRVLSEKDIVEGS